MRQGILESYGCRGHCICSCLEIQNRLITFLINSHKCFNGHFPRTLYTHAKYLPLLSGGRAQLSLKHSNFKMYDIQKENRREKSPKLQLDVFHRNKAHCTLFPRITQERIRWRVCLRVDLCHLRFMKEHVLHKIQLFLQQIAVFHFFVVMSDQLGWLKADAMTIQTAQMICH